MPRTATQPIHASFIGRPVIIRSNGAGVHFGTLERKDGDVVVLANSRRLWSWTANKGVALSGLAVHGLKDGKVDTILPLVLVERVLEVIPCTDKSAQSILAAA